MRDFVDKIFVITTENSERVEYVKNHLFERNIHNYEFFVAPDYHLMSENHTMCDTQSNDVRASISLLCSFRSIIEMCRINDFEKIMIIEDDCYLIPNYMYKLSQFLENIPHDWDVLNLKYHHLHATDTIFEKFNDYANIPLKWHHTTHMMAIKNTIYEQYIAESNKNLDFPVDYVFNLIYANAKFKCFYPTSPFAYQLSLRVGQQKDPILPFSFKSSII